MPEYVVEKRGPVAIVRIDRPQALNALTQQMLVDFESEWPRLSADPEVRAVVITGTGEKGFCSGIDLSQTDFTAMRQPPSLNYSEHWAFRLQQLTKPTIAAVNGVAAGGGLALALACDIRVCADKARFGTAFARIGMSVIDGVGHMLVQAVGLSKALELIYTAEVIDAREAERIGLVSYVHPQEELLDRAIALANKLAEGPPIAQGLSKAAVYGAVGRSFLEYVPLQYLSVQLNSKYAPHDIAEGGKAFREKRKPRFRGPLAEQS